jgi:hypothetical protein
LATDTADVTGDLSSFQQRLELVAEPMPRGSKVWSRIVSTLGRAWWPEHAPVLAPPAEMPQAALAATRVIEPVPSRLTMHGVLGAWREAERALAELPEGTPEWAAVNATIISLRATYRARFDEYLAS